LPCRRILRGPALQMSGAGPAWPAAVHRFCGSDMVVSVAPAAVSFIVDGKEVPFIPAESCVFFDERNREEAGQRRTVLLEVNGDLLRGAHASCLEPSGQGLPEVIDFVVPRDPNLKRIVSSQCGKKKSGRPWFRLLRFPSPEAEVSCCCLEGPSQGACWPPS
jgi:hypothetical protein